MIGPVLRFGRMVSLGTTRADGPTDSQRGHRRVLDADARGKTRRSPRGDALAPQLDRQPHPRASRRNRRPPSRRRARGRRPGSTRTGSGAGTRSAVSGWRRRVADLGRPWLARWSRRVPGWQGVPRAPLEAGGPGQRRGLSRSRPTCRATAARPPQSTRRWVRSAASMASSSTPAGRPGHFDAVDDAAWAQAIDGHAA